VAGGAADRERLAEVATMGVTGESGRRNLEAEMLQRIEGRLGLALHVVGGRRNAIDEADAAAGEEAAYCDGFCDALRYVFGTDGEADLIMEELVEAWDRTGAEGLSEPDPVPAEPPAAEPPAPEPVVAIFQLADVVEAAEDAVAAEVMVAGVPVAAGVAAAG
jgi:hypothetical protein